MQLPNIRKVWQYLDETGMVTYEQKANHLTTYTHPTHKIILCKNTAVTQCIDMSCIPFIHHWPIIIVATVFSSKNVNLTYVQVFG